MACSCSRWSGETLCLSCGQQRAYCSLPDNMNMESHGGNIMTDEIEVIGKKPVPVPLRPPHRLNVARNRAEIKSWRWIARCTCCQVCRTFPPTYIWVSVPTSCHTNNVPFLPVRRNCSRGNGLLAKTHSASHHCWLPTLQLCLSPLWERESSNENEIQSVTDLFVTFLILFQGTLGLYL
jgi:hypothetical protein